MKMLQHTAQFLLLMILVTSCSHSRYGYLSKVKSNNKHVHQEAVVNIRKEAPPKDIHESPETLVTASAGSEIILSDPNSTTLSKVNMGKASQVVVNPNPHYTKANDAHEKTMKNDSVKSAVSSSDDGPGIGEGAVAIGSLSLLVGAVIWFLEMLGGLTSSGLRGKAPVFASLGLLLILVGLLLRWIGV